MLITFLPRAFVALLSISIALFVGGAWSASDAAMSVGSALFFLSGVPLVLFVPVLMAEAFQAKRLADGRSQPQRRG